MPTSRYNLMLRQSTPTVGWICLEMENPKTLIKVVMDLKDKGYKLCDCGEPKTFPAEKGLPIYVYTENIHKEGFIGRIGLNIILYYTDESN